MCFSCCTAIITIIFPIVTLNTHFKVLFADNFTIISFQSNTVACIAKLEDSVGVDSAHASQSNPLSNAHSIKKLQQLRFLFVNSNSNLLSFSNHFVYCQIEVIILQLDELAVNQNQLHQTL